jgi:quinol monooxygenase YgiN
MYGTVARMKVTPGKMDEFIAFSKEFAAQDRPKGYLGEHIFRLDSDPNQVMMVVLFEDKASYHANANDPEMDKQYQRYRAMLEADPEWNDGEIIYNSWEK